MLNEFVLVLPIAAFFGGLFWLMIFLASYMHFPKMEKSERLKMSLENATLMTLLIFGMVALVMMFLVWTNVLHG